MCDVLYFIFNFIDNLTPFGTANQSSRFTSSGGNPEDAILPPISNIVSFNYCSHTDTGRNDSAWWMFHFSLGSAYITDVTIYYREECKYTYFLSSQYDGKTFP